MRRTCLLLVAYLTTAFLGSAEVSGRWSADEPRGHDTVAVVMNLQLEADGAAVTGTVTGPEGEAEISDGRIDDDEISFSVIRESDGDQITQIYRGTVEDDLIHFRLTVKGARFGDSWVREFNARRVS